MVRVRNDPHGRGVDTDGLLPPILNGHPVQSQGHRLVALDQLDERRVAEVRTDRHGVLAVGITPDGKPFAVSNTCRHQFARLGRGRVTDQGCLECPWHRARYDVENGDMVEGPKGRLLGFRPYSAMFRAVGNVLRLRRFGVHIRDGAIYLDDR